MCLITSEHCKLHFWTYLQNCFCPLQHFVLVKSTKLDQLLNFSTAEVKLLIFLCYFVVTFFISLVIFAITGIDYDTNFDFFDYLHCELGGYDSNDPCDDSVLFQSNSVTLRSIFTLMLNVTAPLMFLLFVVNVQELKEMCKKLHKKLSS